ncbi:MAG: hypothetical protein RIS94_2561 [Pseudomonadota bacterium]|jgi:DNA-binding transcriptional ArsR family regulator
MTVRAIASTRRKGRAIRAAEAPLAETRINGEPVPDGPRGQMALALAREFYVGRRRRGRFLSADLFGEPTWDILLDLYVASRENRRVPTTSACIGAHVPPTTALRWLRILESRGLVEREDDGRDGRRTFVRLTPRGLAAMDGFLQSTITALQLAIGDAFRDPVEDDEGLAQAAQ